MAQVMIEPFGKNGCFCALKGAGCLWKSSSQFGEEIVVAEYHTGVNKGLNPQYQSPCCCIVGYQNVSRPYNVHFNAIF